MPFPSLIMGFIAKTRLKVPSGFTIVPRDYPICANIVTQSKAHITGSRTGISHIPRDNFEEEGGDTEGEVNRFTSASEGSTQPSSQAQAQGPDHLDHLIARIEQMYGMFESHVQHTADQFTYIQGQITTLSSQIEDMTMAQGSDSESKQFQLLWPFWSKKGRKF